MPHARHPDGTPAAASEDRRTDRRWYHDIADIIRAFVADAGPRAAIRTVALMLAAALAEALTLALLAPLLAVLTQSGDGRLRHVVEDGFALLHVDDPSRRIAVLMLAMVVMIAIRSVILAARDMRLSDLQRDFIDHMRSGLIRRVAGSGWQAFLTLRHARIAQALGNDIARTALCLHMILSVMLAIVMLGAQWLVVLVLTPTLALLVVIGGVVGGGLAIPMIRRARAVGATTKHGHLRLLDTTAQLMGGLKLAMAQNLSAAFVDEFDAAQRDIAQHQRAFDVRRTRIQAWNSTGFAAVLAAIVLGSQWLHVPVAPLIASLAILARMAGPFVRVTHDARDIASSLPFYRGLRELEIDLPGDCTGGDRPGGTTCDDAAPPIDGSIRFDGAGFTHRGGTVPTLMPIDLTIAPGEVVGITGSSGSGKTTFVDLICGLLAPMPGQLLVGDRPLTPDRLPVWREQLAYVAQDAYLFNDTIRRNLNWGRAPLADDRLWEALALVDADGIVRSMPGGLDANVAERGARLSGGERQRLALARALLRMPRLLILDEATNAVSIDAERLVLGTLLPALKRTTVMIVTHRPETLAFCDRVLVFADGGLVSDDPR